MEKILQVSEFIEAINHHLSLLPEVTVEGEITECKPYQDKFLYITLKDPATSATTSVFAIAYNISGWRNLEPGMKVQVYGTAKLATKSGKFSLNASQIIPAGEGALRIAFEKLKLQLEKEGLFSTDRKRQVNRFPSRIGLITAKNSEAYNDFVKVLKERMGGLEIIFFPVSVQGRDSVSSILKTFNYINNHPELKLDCVVLCRGGGSLEDLISFNDEQIVRAVFRSIIPVVVGVGHERDVSLCDLVADIRASTPSNAAELLVLHRRELISRVEYATNRLVNWTTNNLQSHQNRHMFATKALISAMSSHISRQNHRLSRLVITLEQKLAFPIQRIKRLINRFEATPHTVTQKIHISHTQIEKTSYRLQDASARWLKNQKNSLEQTTRLLQTFDHTNVLKRGYSLTQTSEGKLIKSAKDVKTGTIVLSQLHDGTITSIAK